MHRLGELLTRDAELLGTVESRDNGLRAFDGFLQTKTVWIKLTGATRDPFVIG